MGAFGHVWYRCLKIENCCLKAFVEISVGEKVCGNTCLKTENCLKTFTKHPLYLYVNISYLIQCVN